MLTALIILAVILLLVLDYFIAREFSMFANKKGFRGCRYFWWSFFFGLIGWLMVIALPDQYPFGTAEKTKPGCTFVGNTGLADF